jgi:hypothetical protein
MQRTDHVPESDRGEGRTAKDTEGVQTEPATRDTSPLGDQTGRTGPIITEPPAPPVTDRPGTRETDFSTDADASPSNVTTPDSPDATKAESTKAEGADVDATAANAAPTPEFSADDDSADTASATTTARPAADDTDQDTEVTPRRSPRHSEHVLDPALSSKYQERWREVQAAFVDDPAGAVRSADDLVMEVTSALSTAVTQRRESLGTHTGDGNTETEELRTTLRSYREIVQRLLEV